MHQFVSFGFHAGSSLFEVENQGLLDAQCMTETGWIGVPPIRPTLEPALRTNFTYISICSISDTVHFCCAAPLGLLSNVRTTIRIL